MSEVAIKCPFCGRPAIQTVMLTLALVHNIAVCESEDCVNSAGSVLLAEADPTRRLGGARLYPLGQ